MTPTIQDLAREMLSQIEKRTRDNGETFVALKDDRAEWMRDIAHAACADMLPDDHRYSFIVEALNAIAEGDEHGDEIEADIYTHDLTAWLHSRADRAGYCDLACEDGFVSADAPTLDRLQAGQLCEKREVHDLVLHSLEIRLEEAESE